MRPRRVWLFYLESAMVILLMFLVLAIIFRFTLFGQETIMNWVLFFIIIIYAVTFWVYEWVGREIRK